MNLFAHFFGICIVVSFKFVSLNGETNQVQTLTTADAPSKALNYTILKESSGINVQLKLTGNDFNSPKKCYIQKSAENLLSYTDIDTCSQTEGQCANNSCCRTCAGDGNKFTFDEFSPRTKYVVIFTGEDTQPISKTNGGTVFGLELALLVNPQVSITVTSAKKLKLSTITCKQVDCPIYFKDVKYAEGGAGSSCTVPCGSDDEVEFDLMIPHYEMRCMNYPSFFYKLRNAYTLRNMDVYKPHHYVKYNDTGKSKYLIKFTNKFPSEICRFSIKDKDTPFSTAEKNGYTSNCGGTNKDCYAPCNDVELSLTGAKSVVDVMIQSRHFPLTKNANNNYHIGYQQRHLVVTEPSAAGDALLSDIKKNGVTLNAPQFNSSEGIKLVSCAVKYYAADKPKDDETDVTCGDNASTCQKNCQNALIITGLSSGKPYILTITLETSSEIPGIYKEHIFFRTKNDDTKIFPGVTPMVGEKTASIKAIDGDKVLTNSDITCAYYVSPRGKDVYVGAMCVGSHPCRGYCRENQTIVGLRPGTEYDLKVVAHKEYGTKIYQITTVKLALTLENQFVDKGFKIIGVLPTPDSTAKCHYNVEIKYGENYKLIYQCPQAPISTEPAEESVSKSKYDKIKIARSGADETTPPTNKTIPQTVHICTEIPLCSEILFTNNYDRLKKYRIVVTTIDEEAGGNLEIPENPLPTSTDINKQIIVSIKRDGNKLVITTVLPPEVVENTCGWELRDSTNPDKVLIKSCNGENDGGCASLPKCNEFEIADVEDTNDYQLTVYVSNDQSIKGDSEIKKGETYDTMKSTSKNTIIIVVTAVVGVVVLAAIIFIIIKKKN